MLNFFMLLSPAGELFRPYVPFCAVWPKKAAIHPSGKPPTHRPGRGLRGDRPPVRVRRSKPVVALARPRAAEANLDRDVAGRRIEDVPAAALKRVDVRCFPPPSAGHHPTGDALERELGQAPGEIGVAPPSVALGAGTDAQEIRCQALVRVSRAVAVIHRPRVVRRVVPPGIGPLLVSTGSRVLPFIVRGKETTVPDAEGVRLPPRHAVDRFGLIRSW